MGSIKPNKFNIENLSKQIPKTQPNTDTTSKAKPNWSNLQTQYSARDSSKTFSMHMDQELAKFDKRFEQLQTPASVAKDFKSNR